ncbi:hypothetical protein BC833DRAFT_653965 [Globomyces pollinis-pini]|nr:hypothetical protein BC833DRAFT_653965 [Globomyces pollinis-pini]
MLKSINSNGLCGTNIKVIISASATNEGCPTEWRGWQVHDISSHRFDDDEFKVWCDHYHLENVGKVDPESEEAVDAFFWTGGVPYELRLLWDQPKERLMEKTILYRKKRINDMCEIHSKFCSRLSEEDRLNVMECVSRMLIGASHPEESIEISKELVDIIDDEDGYKIVTALNPVARRALLYYYAGMLVVSVTDLALVKSLRSVTALALQRGYYTNDMKGRITVNYITTMLELSKRFSFQWKKATNIDLSTVKSDLKEIEIQNIIHFSGNKLPLRNSFYSKYYGDNRISTLFIPKSPNSGGPDFLIWDPFEEVLMAFQVILKQPFPKIDTDSDNCKMWLDFCFGSLVKKPMKVYWIIPENCAVIPKNGEERVILLDELHEDFPALKKLTL